jgi:hypothetical protein
VTEALDFVQRHAQVLLFIWIFIDQLGVPIPAVPTCEARSISR